jgi:hypothetical protein
VKQMLVVLLALSVGAVTRADEVTVRFEGYLSRVSDQIVPTLLVNVPVHGQVRYDASALPDLTISTPLLGHYPGNLLEFTVALPTSDGSTLTLSTVDGYVQTVIERDLFILAGYGRTVLDYQELAFTFVWNLQPGSTTRLPVAQPTDLQTSSVFDLLVTQDGYAGGDITSVYFVPEPSSQALGSIAGIAFLIATICANRVRTR